MRAKVTQAWPDWVYACECGRVSARMAWRDALTAARQHVRDAHNPRVPPAPEVQRYRCTVTGCNPVLWGEVDAWVHASDHGHRTAKWPVRSAEGKRRAKARNRSGYYDKYNVGHKARGGSYGAGVEFGDDSHPFSPEALGQE